MSSRNSKAWPVYCVRCTIGLPVDGECMMCTAELQDKKIHMDAEPLFALSLFRHGVLAEAAGETPPLQDEDSVFEFEMYLLDTLLTRPAYRGGLNNPTGRNQFNRDKESVA